MIEFVDVGKKYFGGSQYVLEHINLEIYKGEFFVLLGASGSGKTTLMKMINAMEQPTYGKILFKNQPINQLNLIELRKSIGYVIQEVGLFPHYTVHENIATVLRLHKLANPIVEKKVENWMLKLGLEYAIQKDKLPGQLSGGQVQRVGLARALVNSPELVLMDEPFSALDPQIRKSIRQDFKKIQKDEGNTVVMVTHDLLEAIELADRICFLANGSIQFLGSPANFVLGSKSQLVQDFIQGENFHASLAACKIADLKEFLPQLQAMKQSSLLDLLANSSEEEQQQLMNAFYLWKESNYA